MKTFQLCLICACLVWKIVQGNDADVLTKRDSSFHPYHKSPVDYERFLNRTDAIERQADFGLDAGVILGIIGTILGIFSILGIAVHTNNIDTLSKDQDNICTVNKAVGNTVIAQSNIALTIGATVAADNTNLNAQFNSIIDQINAFANSFAFSC